MVKTREEVVQEDKWAVEVLYSSLEEWEKEFQQASDDKFLRVDALQALKGKLGEGVESLKVALEIYFAGSRVVEKLYTYAHLKHDEDLTNDAFKSCYGKVATLHQDLQEKTAWLEPEILSLPSDVIEQYLASPVLAEYRFHIEKIVHMKAHTLSPEMEKLLAQTSQALSSSMKTFGALNNGDLVFGKVVDSENNSHDLTHASFGNFIRSKDRVLRENAFKQYHNKFLEFQNTLSETLNGQVQANWFLAKARNYSSSLEAALYPKSIPVEVYKSLIEAVRSNINHLHRYVALRKRVLNLDKVHLFDMYVPLVKHVDIKKTYAEAEQATIEAARFLGEEYQNTIKQGLINDRWVDRFENKGKRSGAYSSGCYDSYPYILMNFEGNLNDVFTLVHEAGHSMHSYLSRKNQPYHYSDYSIFVAEVASTFNEALLRHDLLQRTEKLLQSSNDENIKNERIYLINQAVEDIRTTLFRQTMFAEFELKIYEFVENKTPLTPALLKKTYRELNEFYFGPDALIDEEIDIEWARVPHFYYNFYVYQYATGISAALYLSEKVLHGGEQERSDYLSFLKGGCTKYPIDMLKVAGVDMCSKEPVQRAIQKFGELVDQLTDLLQ